MENQQLDRRDVVRALLADREQLLVVTGLGSSAYDVMAAGDHDRNLYLWGAMGGAAMVGFGLAQAQPETPVLVVTGDGEQIMGLGALATIATLAPPNLTLVVLDNGHYGETGMQQSHSSKGLSLPGVATACGFPDSRLVKTGNELTDFISRVHKPNCLGFASIEVQAQNPTRVLPTRDGIYNKNRFREALGIAVNL